MTGNIFIVILITSLATFLSRFLGVISSENIKETSKIFRWFNCLAYSTLAALIARIVIFPSGLLSEIDYLVRLIVIILLINLDNLLLLKSSKLFAIVNLVNGLYSNAVISNLLKGKISLFKISSPISMLIILGDCLFS